MKINKFLERNNYLLADGNGYRKLSKKNTVNLNWWHVDYEHCKQNLGDMLSEVVFEYMCEKYCLEKEKKVKKTKHLYVIGSILFFENQDATVWGAGCICSPKRNIKNFIRQRIMRKLDVRAVRGPKTREELQKLGIKCPEIYGDPAMLLPLIYEPKKKSEKKVVVIEHYKDSLLNKDTYKPNNFEYVDMITDDWRTVIDVIASAKLVISSSLHGIIVAESYGVPAVLLKPKMENDLFKYEDYYRGTNRKILPIVDTIDEGLQIDIRSLKKPNVKEIQENLIMSFPKDLWENG